MEVVPAFFTPLGFEFDFLPEYLLKKVKQQSLELTEQVDGDKHGFTCDVWSSFSSHDITKDPKFYDLVFLVEQAVNRLTRKLGALNKMVATEGWLNSYGPMDYQEVHVHSPEKFSAVLFVEVPEGSAPLILRNPAFPFDPIKMESPSPWANAIDLEPVENRLVIFPSTIDHYVPRGSNKTNRVTIAMNFSEGEPW